MNAGFALVEPGLCRAKNAVNLTKNFIVSASTLSFWAIGFGLMFGDGSASGNQGLLSSGADNSPAL